MIQESLLIKKVQNNPNKSSMNNKLEYSRTVLPDIGRKEPTTNEIKEEEKLDIEIRRLRKEKQEKTEKERKEKKHQKRENKEVNH